MKLIGLKKEGVRGVVQFYGCQLRCGYCTHIRQPFKERSVEEVVEFLADPTIGEIYLGGAEPSVQRKELEDLLGRFAGMHKKVVLKTNGADPELISRTMGLVDLHVIEIKCPLDDIECYSSMSGMSRERTIKYLNSLRRSIGILKGRPLRVWIRIVPGMVTTDSIARLGADMEGAATEVHLYQFLSNPENDAPFMGIESVGPGQDEMMAMAETMLRFVPRVVVLGKGFKAELEAPPSPL